MCYVKALKYIIAICSLVRRRGFWIRCAMLVLLFRERIVLSPRVLCILQQSASLSDLENVVFACLYHSQNLYTNITRYRDCNAVDGISKLTFGRILWVWTWPKLDLELVGIFSSSPSSSCHFFKAFDTFLTLMKLTVHVYYIDTSNSFSTFFQNSNHFLKILWLYDFFGLSILIFFFFPIFNSNTTCCTYLLH